MTEPSAGASEGPRIEASSAMGARRRTGRYVAYAFLCLLAAGLGGLLYRGVTAFMAGVERGRVVQGLDAVKDQRQAVRVACEVVLAYPDEARAHELLLRFTSPLGREPLLDPLKPLFERPGGEAAGGRGLRILAGRYWYGRGELTRTAAAYEPIAADPTLPVTDRRRLIRTWARVGQTGRAAAAVMALAPQAPKVRLDLLEALLASDAAADSPWVVPLAATAALAVHDEAEPAPPAEALIALLATPRPRLAAVLLGTTLARVHSKGLTAHREAVARTLLEGLAGQVRERGEQKPSLAGVSLPPCDPWGGTFGLSKDRAAVVCTGTGTVRQPTLAVPLAPPEEEAPPPAEEPPPGPTPTGAASSPGR